MAKANSQSKRTRVFIIDNRPMLHVGVAAQIDLQRDLEICGEAEDLTGATLQKRLMDNLIGGESPSLSPIGVLADREVEAVELFG